MSENEQEVAQLKEQIRRFVNNSTRYSVGPRTFQRLVELDPEGASAVAADCQRIQESYKEEVNVYFGRMSRTELDDYRRSIDAAEVALRYLADYGVTTSDP